ncbi:MAG TPA: hypothetical protein VGH42_01700 [Verrucomicrobiae bacterium]|jgi:hypothetical protein
MKPDFKFKFRKRKKLTTLLGLALDGGRLDGVVLRRANGALQLLQKFSAQLTLDPLTAAPELVGREIRNHLDAAGVRERNCIVGVPLKWVLTAQTELPQLPEADAASLLQMEAERGFHSDTTALQIANSRSALAGGKKFVLLAAVPNTHVGALERVLAAAKLKPAGFALGISALQFPGGEKSGGVLALAIGEGNVGLQITTGGGVTALRALEGAIENEAGHRALVADVVTREARVTLGQLPSELRDAVKLIRIFGPRELAQQLADEMELRFEPMGLKVEIVSAYAPDEFGVTLPPEAPLSAAFSLAAGFLTEQKPAFEFLPPKPTVIEQFITKYSSGRLRTTGAVAAGVAAIILLLFLFQQIQLWRLRSQWSQMQAKVTDLQNIQDEIVQYRPWYDDSFRSLAILRQLTLAFPQDGEVTAKTIEIHDGNTVSCSGNARDNTALLAMLSKLRSADGVSDLKVDQIRGKSPMQFTFDFQYGNGGANEN